MSETGNKSTLRAAAYLLAALIPAAALYASAARGDAPSTAAVSPFGWHFLAALHIVAALPIGILLGVAVVRALTGHSHTVWALAACAAGALVALWTASSGQDVGQAIEKVQAGFMPRLIVRTLWCVLLVAPWCMAACLFSTRGIVPGGGAVVQVVTWALALFVAGGLPAVYSLNAVREETARANELLSSGRLWKATSVVDALCDVGATRPVVSPADGQVRVTPRAARQQLVEQLAFHARQVKPPLSDEATPPQRVEHAMHLAALGRLNEALTAVEPAATENGSAALMTAALLDDLTRWEESHQTYRDAARLLAAGDDAQVAGAKADRSMAFDGLAKTARDLGRYREAEGVYVEAIAALPEREAYFRFQLGRHYQLGGRPLDAMAAFRRAAQLDPERFALDGPLAAQYVVTLRQETPGCVLPTRDARTREE